MNNEATSTAAADLAMSGQACTGRPAGECGTTMGQSGESTPEPFSQAARDRLVRLAYRFVWNRDDAEDVVQESLAAAHEQSAQLREPGHWWSWLRRIVIHRCHTSGRRKMRWRVHGERIAAASRESSEDDAGGGAARGDIADLVRRALPQLPQRQKEVVVLRHLEGMSYEQIAELLEISPVTARVHARAGLETLRTMLAERASRHAAESERERR